MKKFFRVAAILCALLTTQYSYAQDNDDSGCCPPPDQPCGDCWCLYCHYEPCYYNTKRCIDVPQYYKKKCCRYVPKYYEVKKCRYVPQYYSETCCKYEPEYYCVDECKMCKKEICERKCRWVPRYYYKHVCGDNSCNTPCPNGGQPSAAECRFARPADERSQAIMNKQVNGEEYTQDEDRGDDNFSEKRNWNNVRDNWQNRKMNMQGRQNWRQNRDEDQFNERVNASDIRDDQVDQLQQRTIRGEQMNQYQYNRPGQNL